VREGPFRIGSEGGAELGKVGLVKTKMAPCLVALDRAGVHNHKHKHNWGDKMTETRRRPGYYGAAVEGWVVERYDLDRTYKRVRGVKMDAVEPETGRPVEIKAVARNRRGGRASGVSFKIWRDQHRALAEVGGYYVFVEYDLLSDGIGVRNHRAIRSGAVTADWYGETQPRGEQQAEIPARELFS